MRCTYKFKVQMNYYNYPNKLLNTEKKKHISDSRK